MKQELSKIINPYLGSEEWGHIELTEKLEKYFKQKINKKKVVKVKK